MPGARDALCHQALQLLAELCARGALEHDSCQDFIYHLRDRARPRLRDPGKRCYRPGATRGPWDEDLGAEPGPEAGERRRLKEGRGVTIEPKEVSESGAPWPETGTGQRTRAEAAARRPSQGGLGQARRNHTRHLGAAPELQAAPATSPTGAGGGRGGLGAEKGIRKPRKLWEVGSLGQPGCSRFPSGAARSEFPVPLQAVR